MSVRTGDRVQVWTEDGWVKNGMIEQSLRNGRFTVSIGGRTLRGIKKEHLWRHKTTKRRRSKKRRHHRKNQELQQQHEKYTRRSVPLPASQSAAEPFAATEQPALATTPTSAAGTQCGLFGCTLPRRHRGICAVAIACHRRGDVAVCWLPLSPVPPPSTSTVGVRSTSPLDEPPTSVSVGASVLGSANNSSSCSCSSCSSDHGGRSQRAVERRRGSNRVRRSIALAAPAPGVDGTAAQWRLAQSRHSCGWPGCSQCGAIIGL